MHKRHILKSWGCNQIYDGTCGAYAERNLIMSGGIELPQIVAGMLKAYYYKGEASSANSHLRQTRDYIVNNNVANYQCEAIDELYDCKIGTLLYDTFTGMRLGSKWSGKLSVNGGYIIAKGNGDVLAYHSCFTDEFKEFLINNTRFEAPSARRHDYLYIFKEDDNYYIKFIFKFDLYRKL